MRSQPAAVVLAILMILPAMPWLAQPAIGDDAPDLAPPLTTRGTPAQTTLDSDTIAATEAWSPSELSEATVPAAPVEQVAQGSVPLLRLTPTLPGLLPCEAPLPVPIPPLPQPGPIDVPVVGIHVEPPSLDLAALTVEYRLGQACRRSAFFVPTEVTDVAGAATFLATLVPMGSAYRIEVTIAVETELDDVVAGIGYHGINVGLLLRSSPGGTATIRVDIPGLLPGAECPSSIDGHLSAEHGSNFDTFLIGLGPAVFGITDPLSVSLTLDPAVGSAVDLAVDGTLCGNIAFDATISEPVTTLEGRLGVCNDCVTFLVGSDPGGTPLTFMHLADTHTFLNDVWKNETTLEQNAVLGGRITHTTSEGTTDLADITRLPQHIKILSETTNNKPSHFQIVGDKVPVPGAVVIYTQLDALGEQVQRVTAVPVTFLDFDMQLDAHLTHIEAKFAPGAGIVTYQGLFTDDNGNERWDITGDANQLSSATVEIDTDGQDTCGCDFSVSIQHDATDFFLEAKEQKLQNDGATWADMQFIRAPAVPQDVTLRTAKVVGSASMGNFSLEAHDGQGQWLHYQFRSRASDAYADAFIERFPRDLTLTINDTTGVNSDGIPEEVLHAVATHTGEDVHLKLDLASVGAGVLDINLLPRVIDFTMKKNPGASGTNELEPTDIVVLAADAPPGGSTFDYQLTGGLAGNVHLTRVATFFLDFKKNPSSVPIVTFKASFDDQAGSLDLLLASTLDLHLTSNPDFQLDGHGSKLGSAVVKYNLPDSREFQVVANMAISGDLDLVFKIPALLLQNEFELKRPDNLYDAYSPYGNGPDYSEGSCFENGFPWWNVRMCAAPGGCSERSPLRIYQGENFALGCARYVTPGLYNLDINSPTCPSAAPLPCSPRFDNYDLIKNDGEAIKVGAGYEVKVCAQANLAGTCERFLAGRHNLPSGLANSIASFELKIWRFDDPAFLSNRCGPGDTIWLRSAIYLFCPSGGGLNGPRIFTFDPKTGTTTRITYSATVTTDFSKYGLTVETDGRYAYVFNSGANKMGRYDSESNSFVELGGHAVSRAATVFDGNLIYFAGGSNCGGIKGIGSYDPANNIWDCAYAYFPDTWSGGSLYFGGFVDASAAWSGQYVYIFGGEKRSSDGSLNSYDAIWRFDPATRSVSEMTAKMPAKISLTTAVFDGDRAWIFGGYDDHGGTTSNKDFVITYDPSSDEATLVDHLPIAYQGAPDSLWASAWDADSSTAYITSDAPSYLKPPYGPIVMPYKID